MRTADALAHVGDSVLDFSRRFESSTEKLIGALKPVFDASPIRRAAAVHLCYKWTTRVTRLESCCSDRGGFWF